MDPWRRRLLAFNRVRTFICSEDSTCGFGSDRQFPLHLFSSVNRYALPCFCSHSLFFICLARLLKGGGRPPGFPFGPCAFWTNIGLAVLSNGGILGNIILFATKGNLGSFFLSEWNNFLLMSTPYFTLLLLSFAYCFFDKKSKKAV